MSEIAGPKLIGGFSQALRIRATLASLLNRVVFCSLLALIVWTTIPYGTVDQWWDAFFEAAVFSICALWICGALLQGAWRLSRLKVMLPVVILTAYAFIQTLRIPAVLSTTNGQIVQHTLGIDPYQTYLTALKLLALVLFLGLLLLQTYSPRRLKWLFRVVVGLGVASAVFALFRQLLQSAESPEGFVLPYLFYGYGYGLFLSPNLFAYQAEMCLAVILGLAFGGGVPRAQILIYVALALTVWSALILSVSRGGIVAFTCSFIFVVTIAFRWYVARKSSRSNAIPGALIRFASLRSVQIMALVVMLIVISAGVMWMGGEKLAFKLSGAHSSSDDTVATGLTRTEIWRSTVALIKQHPITGVGFGAYYLAIPQHQAGAGQLKVEEAHNDYLDLTASGGLIAVALSAWFVLLVIRKAFTAWRSRDSFRRAVCLGASAALVAAAVHSAVDFGLQVTGMAVYFVAILVLAIANTGDGQRRPARPQLVNRS